MAFLASRATQNDALNKAMQRAVYIKALCARATARMASNAGADFLLGILAELRAGLAEMDALAATPGLAAYARTQFDDPAYDVAAEYSAMRAELQSVIDWFAANFPKDGSNRVLAYTIAANGELSPVQFTPVQMSPLVARLNALAAKIS